jgi:NAD(P)-dependent dehydrogenase (short-subunit alcohol dehydrogenase family)
VSYRFDGRVAVVTGAGRGIGRAYALLLASRGCSVVVNDLGSSLTGDGSDTSPAESVVSEIAAAGGAAVVDTNDVSSPEGGEKVVSHALSAFGHIDAVINNAGIIEWAGLPELDAENIQRHLDVHLLGSFNTVRAAWPHFESQGYGRVVMTTSTGVFGLPNNTGYAAAKGAVIGLTRSLAVAGAASGIKVNAIAPAAMTRMAGRSSPELEQQMDPARVAPMAAYLAHEDCPVNGEIYAAGAGRFGRIFIGTTPGVVVDGTSSIEDVAKNWTAINDTRDFAVPDDLITWSARHLKHLDPDA